MAEPVTGASRQVVGMVRAMRWILWALLLAAVVATLGGLPGGEPRSGGMPGWLAVASTVLLGLFVVGYAVYRFALVRAGRYPAGKAMVQLVLMSLVLVVMARWPAERARQGGGGPVDIARALASSDPDARALAAEVLRARPRAEALAHGERLVALLGDPSQEVRRQAQASLAALVGEDLGGGPEATPRWTAALQSARR